MSGLIQYMRSKRSADAWTASFFVAVTVLVIGPLYARGYILQYDMVFAPTVHFNVEATTIYAKFALTGVLWLVGHILPMDIVQKILLTAIFFIAGWGIYRSTPVSSRIARATAGFIYMVNPFVYDRLMAGHWRFLLAYAITPFILRAFYDFYREPTRRKVLISVTLWTIAILMNIHHGVILGLLFLCLGVFYIRSKKTLLYTILMLLTLLIANIWWIIIAASSPASPGSFSLDHFYAFQTNTDPSHGLWFNMLSLQGFWFDEWATIKDSSSWWPAIVLLWLSPVYMGLASIRQWSNSRRKLIYGLTLASLLGIFYAAGPAPGVWEVNTWLYENVPGLSGLREPQKLLALLALFYAISAAYGIDWLVRLRKRNIAIATSVITVGAMGLMVPNIWWGAGGQLSAQQYPESWKAYARIIQKDDSARAVVLPWSLYVDSTFTNTLVANPAKAYYGDKVIVSDRMNIPNLDDSETSDRAGISIAVKNRDAEALAIAMRDIGADYVLLTNTDYPESDKWLIDSPLFTSVHKSPDLGILTLTLP